ncbi:MAG: ATPase [Chloroflexi bacterium]|nr:ATPase [Chloroflexota bacterium]
MDILELVDRLEELVNDSPQIPSYVPFFHGVVLDEDKVWDLIDQMRIAVPEEVRKARKILAQKERIIAQAQEQARRVLQEAEEEKARRVAEHEIVQEAERRAAEILAEAEAEAERMRAEAAAYARELLTNLERHLARALREVQAGARVLEHSVVVPTEPPAETE